MSAKNGSGGKPDVEALRDEIEHTRAELGETVQALAAKADVKARAKEEVAEVKARVKAQAADAGEKVREAAHQASDKVAALAGKAKTQANAVASQAAPLSEAASEKAQQAQIEVRKNPIPYAAALAGIVAAIGVILIIRGRRR